MARRVLLVDDEEDVVEASAMGLRRHGFEVDTQSNPLKAISEFRPRVYGTVILDVRMIQMDGIELYRRMVAVDAQAKYFFLSAYHPDEYGNPPKPSEVGYLTKPIGLSDLVSPISG
ncbi:MAG TPA: response regulator [Nitrososphaerales archaeon]|nr:response regulator [Nitrososphaerales archaeon]